MEEKGPDRIIRNRFKIRQLREVRKGEKMAEELQKFIESQSYIIYNYISDIQEIIWNRTHIYIYVQHIHRFVGLPGMGHYAHQSRSEPTMSFQTRHSKDVSKMRGLFSEEFFQRFHMAYRNYEALFKTIKIFLNMYI